MSPSRRNESTGEEDYVGAGTLLDTDVVATTATKVYHQADKMCIILFYRIDET